jgi:hypothetical protein
MRYVPRLFVAENIGKEMKSMASLGFVFPPFAGQDGGMEIRGRGDPGAAPK